MGAPNSLATGRPIVPATGSIQNVLPRDCTLLGIFSTTAGTTCAIYDSATVAAAGAGNLLCTLTLAAGWNPFPISLIAGLCVNASAAVQVVAA